MIVAIHQPNLFPWLGFFDKLNRADCFVYLDHVKSFRNRLQTKRVKVIMGGTPQWLTIPVRRSSGDEGMIPLSEMAISNEIPFASKHLKTLQQNYGKSEFFEHVFPLVEAYYLSEEPLLVKRNRAFIEAVCEQLAISTQRMDSSALPCKEQSTDLLIEIVQQLKGTTYMTGGGAGGYQEDEKFEQAGIKLIYQDFCHPTYAQLNTKEFVPGLSIIDALMNCGFEGVKVLLDKTKTQFVED